MEIFELTPVEALGMLNEVENKNAPKKLYCAGRIDLLKKSPKVSIVGSRKVSALGKRRAKKLATLLVKRGVTIVSGLAEGVDTVAHTTAIERGGETLSVIGTPLDKSYPASNKELQTRIVSEFLLVSQFPIGSPGGRKNFPMRNRTMGADFRRHRDSGSRGRKRNSSPRMGSVAVRKASLYSRIGGE